VEIVVLTAAFGIAVLCGLLLLFWIVNAIRGKRSKIGQMAATIVVMYWGVWQVYVLNPAVSTNLSYFVAPIAGVSILLILSWAVRDATSEPTSEGPDVKIPAMAMRLPEHQTQEIEKEERKGIAGGQ